MIAVDTSSFVAYFVGDRGVDVEAVDEALSQKIVVLPPVVLTELLSYSEFPRQAVTAIQELPLLGITDGFWERAGVLRAKILSHARKARLADVLIAQSCLDHGVSLVTRDTDFRHMSRHAGLKVIPSH